MKDEAAPGAQEAALAPGSAGPWKRFVRRKGHIGSLGLTVLTIVGCVPLVMAISRILALPGDQALPLVGLGPLRGLGESLNQVLTLDWVPPSDRPSILYLLLLPTGALLVALTRMTFGIRVLGLRAILISIGIRAAGLVPSLTLMAVVVTTIVVVRPWIKRARLPQYARLAIILGLSTMIMLAALMAAPWLRSEAVWSVAFFPVIIMAMLAEGIAKTLEQDNVVTAAWRAGWTIVLALFIAAIYGPVTRVTYQFPELILTQLVVVVFMAEFFDLRLLEKWPDRLSRLIAGARPWYTEKPKIAVVRNRMSQDVIGRLGPPAPSRYRKHSVQRPVDALRDQGFKVRVVEGDMTLLHELNRFLPPDPGSDSPGGIVLNLATGVQGHGRFSQVPAMLEMAGVAYTGPDPVAHAHLADRFALLTQLGLADVSVPGHVVISDPTATVDLEFPLAARPRFEPDASKIVVRDGKSLNAAVRKIRGDYAQPTVVEEIVRGREIRVSLLGNETIECLPLLEYSAKESSKACPAPLDAAHAERVRECARKAYRAAGCRDYARIDIRLSRFGEPRVIDVKWADLFARRGSFVQAAEAAGYDFPTVMRRIVEEAAKRYVAGAAERAEREETGKSSVVSLAERRAAAK